MSSADIQELATGITFSTISLLLTLFCSEVKLWHQQLEAASHWYVRKHSAEHHRQGRWSLDSSTACMRGSERASFWNLNICCKQPQKPTTKTGSFQNHPQSTEENALHFTCLACGSSQGSVNTQECKLKILYTFNSWISHLQLYQKLSKSVNFDLRYTN